MAVASGLISGRIQDTSLMHRSYQLLVLHMKPGVSEPAAIDYMVLAATGKQAQVSICH